MNRNQNKNKPEGLYRSDKVTLTKDTGSTLLRLARRLKGQCVPPFHYYGFHRNLYRSDCLDTAL